MPTHPPALVASDQRFAKAIQAHVKETTGHQLSVYPFETIRDRLSTAPTSLTLLAAAAAADSREIVRLVQDFNLQKWPLANLIVDAGYSNHAVELEHLQGYVDHRLHWPTDAPALTALVHSRLGEYRPGKRKDEEDLEESIRGRLLASTPSLGEMAKSLALAASHNVIVLLTGETGTGKTFLARLIHDYSPRQQHRLMVVPCGALVSNLIESELFGHARGAFTGADRTKVGKFEAVGEGTLLLDEIDTIGLEQQANLLRVIETGEYEPVGSNETRICRARIIVASNWDLERAVEQGKFRQDLYYRLNVMAFHLPPLRERVQDIGPLIRAMAARFNKKFNKDLFDISAEALEALEAFPWPGNIRQLENIAQQSVLVSSGPELLFQHLPKPVQDNALLGNRPAAPALMDAAVHHPQESLVQNCQDLERSVIERALVNAGYSRTHAANALGISRVTLYKKMKKYGLMSSSIS